MATVLLLVASNIFMTLAWYGHLKFTKWPILLAILASWGIAFFEYCLQVPANRIGFQQGYSTFQLKIIQEVITLVVFVVFAKIYFGDGVKWNYIVSFVLILGAVYFAFLPTEESKGAPAVQAPGRTVETERRAA
jgi:uncharacterized protein (DUF486 family)